MGVFPKGLVHGFRLKVSIFPFFCFRQKRPGKYVSRYSRKKKHLSTFKKQEVQEVENFQFFKRLVHGFGKRQNGRKMCFTIFQKEKTLFEDDRNKKFKRSKICIFSKGVRPMILVKNWQFFHFFYFRQHWPGKWVSRYSRMKKLFCRP